MNQAVIGAVYVLLQINALKSQIDDLTAQLAALNAVSLSLSSFLSHLNNEMPYSADECRWVLVFISLVIELVGG